MTDNLELTAAADRSLAWAEGELRPLCRRND